MKHSPCAACPLCLAAAVLFLVASLAPALPGAATDSALAQATGPAPFVLGGYTRVRGGDVTLVLGLVEIDLYCSAYPDTLGEEIATVRSDYMGVYQLAVPRSCEFYNLVAVPPQGYVAYLALSAGGKAINDSWIQYTEPLQGKDLGNNDFRVIADFMVAITPTPFPLRTPRPVPTATRTLSASSSPTASPPVTTSAGLPILEYIAGIVAASGVILAVRRAIQGRPKD